MLRPRRRSAAMSPRVTSVLPEPERGAAMTRPLAERIGPELRGVPIEDFAIAAHGAENDERRGLEVGERRGLAERRVGDALCRRCGVADDRKAVAGVAAGSKQSLGNGAQMLDRHK